MTGTHLHEQSHGVLTADYLRLSPPQLSMDLLGPFLLERWGIEGELSQLSGERDQNIRVDAADGSRYVLKIASLLEDLVLVDFQTKYDLNAREDFPNAIVYRLEPR